MRIKSVQLENIRSYEKARVEFPPGSVLLSGDIGAGKSTLLLAIEFALFGIKRGELTGPALLRRGKQRGKVALDFLVEKKEVRVERSLSRTKSAVRQDSGTITINGVKQQATATELKAQVLELMGYPSDLVQKQKSLLYRYTVYTPQEQMKAIIRADAETRLDTLRKLFGIDRYKTIKENVDLFLKHLRSKKRTLEGEFKHLSEKKNAQKTKRGEFTKITNELEELSKQKDQLEKERDEWKSKKDKIGQQIKLYNEIGKNLAQAEGTQKTVKGQLDSEKKELARKEKKKKDLVIPTLPSKLTIDELTQKIEECRQKREQLLTDPIGFDADLDELLKQKDEIESQIGETKNKESTQEGRQTECKQNKQEIERAENVCPVCGKSLDEKHKQKILREYAKNLTALHQEIKALSEKRKSLESDLEELEKKIQEHINQQLEVYKRKITGLTKSRNEVEDYHQKMEDKERISVDVKQQKDKVKKLQRDFKEISKKIKELNEELEPLKDVKEEERKIEDKLEGLGTEISDNKERSGQAKGRKTEISKQLNDLKTDINRMKEAKAFNKKLSDIETWLSEYLLELVGTIERHFLFELKTRFDALFADWFNLLIEDELLEVKIDDEFSPLILQEGYEAEFNHLSGGESTSLALAYRLALNKVVNSLVEEIKSSDIIILDEPTDGFSDYQLDKIRDVITQLNVPQTIIVSHEPKVESYVDNIIRISKENGISTIT